MELQKVYYENHKEKQSAYNKVCHNEQVDCICGTRITRKTMFKPKESQSCKAVANVCNLLY